MEQGTPGMAPGLPGLPPEMQQDAETLKAQIEATQRELVELEKIEHVQLQAGVLQAEVGFLDKVLFPRRTVPLAEGLNPQGQPLPFVLKGIDDADWLELGHRVREGVAATQERLMSRRAQLGDQAAKLQAALVLVEQATAQSDAPAPETATESAEPPAPEAPPEPETAGAA